MQILERSKSEIIAKAERMSDFLKMEYLENCTKKFSDADIQRYCFLELSKLYERNVMYPDAIKYLARYEEICPTNREKLLAYIKELEILIKGGLYDRVEFVYKKAKDISTPRELIDLDLRISHLYHEEAEKFDKLNKYTPALKVYERLLVLAKGEEKIEIKKRLAYLYNKLGRVREAIEMERDLKR